MHVNAYMDVKERAKRVIRENKKKIKRLIKK